MSRIWDALTVAQDEVTQRLASLSAPSPEQEPVDGSCSRAGQKAFPPPGESDFFPGRDHFAARRQPSSFDFAGEGTSAEQVVHAAFDSQSHSDDQKLESLFLAEESPGAAANEAVQPGAVDYHGLPRTGVRWSALTAASVLMAIVAVAGMQVWRARWAPPGLIPPPGWKVETAPAIPAVKTVVVGPNQTLAGISMLYLGEYNPAVLAKLRELNPGLRDPDHIVVGQQIRLPVPATDGNGHGQPAEKPATPK